MSTHNQDGDSGDNHLFSSWWDDNNFASVTGLKDIVFDLAIVRLNEPDDVVGRPSSNSCGTAVDVDFNPSNFSDFVCC